MELLRDAHDVEDLPVLQGNCEDDLAELGIPQGIGPVVENADGLQHIDANIAVCDSTTREELDVALLPVLQDNGKDSLALSLAQAPASATGTILAPRARSP